MSCTNFLDIIVEKIKERSKENGKDIKVILPESSDLRVLEAGILASKNIRIVFVGKKNEIENNICKLNKNIQEMYFKNTAKIEFINQENKDMLDHFAKELYELRKEKNVTLADAYQLLKDNVYFATMHLKLDMSNALVSGAMHSTKETLRPILQIIKAKKEIGLASSFFIMEIPNYENNKGGIYLFSDCGMIENPTSAELAKIAITSANTFKNIISKEPKVALLSYSTKGSASSELTYKITEAKNILDNLNKEKDLGFVYDGELQLDAAIDREISKSKAKNSKLAGCANVLIFPDLNSGNIGYKLVQRFANAKAYGPICQGLNKIANDLSRGSSVVDILGVIYISALQSLQN